MVVHRQHVDGNVAGVGVALEPFQNAEAGLVRQADVEQDGARPVLARELVAFVAGGGMDAVEIELVRQVVQDGGEAQVVFDDKDQPLAAAGATVVVEPARRQRRGCGSRGGARGRRLARSFGWRR